MRYTQFGPVLARRNVCERVRTGWLYPADSRGSNGLALGQVKLPRDAKLIGDPAEFPAKSIVVGRHFYVAIFR